MCTLISMVNIWIRLIYFNQFWIWFSLIFFCFFYLFVGFFLFLLMFKPNIATNSIDILYILALFISSCIFSLFFFYLRCTLILFLLILLFLKFLCVMSMCFWSAFNCVLPIYFFDAEITRSFYFNFLSNVLLFEENEQKNKKREKYIYSKHINRNKEK